MNPEEFYDQNRESFIGLTDKLKQALLSIIQDPQTRAPAYGIDILTVEAEPKSRKSFIDKVQRKLQRDPTFDFINGINDCVRARIIHYRKSQAEDIINLISDRITIERESRSTEVDKFGYRAIHLSVPIPAEWLKEFEVVGGESYTAEIQVSTLSMHLWSNLSHKVSYKVERLTTESGKRQLYKLAALCEIVDDIYEELSKKGDNNVS